MMENFSDIFLYLMTCYLSIYLMCSSAEELLAAMNSIYIFYNLFNIKPVMCSKKINMKYKNS